MSLSILSPSDQVAVHLREQLLASRWGQVLPGTPTLAVELGVDRKTIMAALNQLEEEGLLKSQGAGRPRLITLPKTKISNALKIRILPYELADQHRPFVHSLINQLEENGHSARLSNKTLLDLRMDVDRISRYMEKEPADLWMPLAASRDVLEWLSVQDVATFAIFGRRRQVSLASIGPDKGPALIEAVQHLIGLGHRRIAYMVREERRKPSPGYIERLYLSELQAHGIATSQFNLPDWEDNTESFNSCIDRLFQHTPPTALLLDESEFFFAASHRLAQSGISAPRDVSLICQDYSAAFEWCQPQVSHINWFAEPLVERTVKWVNQFSRGKNQREVMFTEASFIEGGTTGPVPR